MFKVFVFHSQNELPEPEQDNGGTTESVKEQEMKWTDLALQYLHENIPPTGNQSISNTSHCSFSRKCFWQLFITLKMERKVPVPESKIQLVALTPPHNFQFVDILQKYTSKNQGLCVFNDTSRLGYAIGAINTKSYHCRNKDQQNVDGKSVCLNLALGCEVFYIVRQSKVGKVFGLRSLSKGGGGIFKYLIFFSFLVSVQKEVVQNMMGQVKGKGLGIPCQQAHKHTETGFISPLLSPSTTCSWKLTVVDIHPFKMQQSFLWKEWLSFKVFLWKQISRTI